MNEPEQLLHLCIYLRVQLFIFLYLASELIYLIALGVDKILQVCSYHLLFLELCSNFAIAASRGLLIHDPCSVQKTRLESSLGQDIM